MTSALQFLCRHFQERRCQSCGIIELAYADQLKKKEGQIAELFLPELVLPDSLKPIVAADPVLNSRGKGKFAVTGSGSHPVIRLSDSDFSGIELLDCPLLAPPINEIIRDLKQLLPTFRIPPYDIGARTGELKFIILKTCIGTGEASLRFVLRSRREIRTCTRLGKMLQGRHPGLAVFSANIQPEPAAILEGPEELTLSKSRFTREVLAGVNLFFPAKSFSQVTPNVAVKLYQAAATKIAAKKPRLLLDLYCGTGAFSLFAARQAAQVIGVEITAECREAAEMAAQQNGYDNCSFLSADVESYLQRESLPPVDALILNPPRRGASEKTIQILQRLRPELMLYSSCNPESLKRDLLLLSPYYTVAALEPFDMFPLTEHVETLATLVRRC